MSSNFTPSAANYMKNFEQPNAENNEPDIEINPELLEKWKEMETEIEDIAEGITQLIEPGEQFALHPLSFELTADYDPEDVEEDKIRREVILHYAFAEFGFNPKDVKAIREEKRGETDVKIFPTNRRGVLLDFDGTDWTLEVEKRKKAK